MKKRRKKNEKRKKNGNLGREEIAKNVFPIYEFNKYCCSNKYYGYIKGWKKKMEIAKNNVEYNLPEG